MAILSNKKNKSRCSLHHLWPVVVGPFTLESVYFKLQTNSAPLYILLIKPNLTETTSRVVELNHCVLLHRIVIWNQKEINHMCKGPFILVASLLIKFYSAAMWLSDLLSTNIKLDLNITCTFNTGWIMGSL